MLSALGRALSTFAVTVALAATTPVLGWCATAQHQGQSLHPLFEHAHHEPSGNFHGASSFQSAAFAAIGQSQGLGWSGGAVAVKPLPVALTEPRVVGVSIEHSQLPAEYLTDPIVPPPR